MAIRPAISRPPTVDPEKGWKLQAKFIWDRQIPFHDIVKKHTYHFDTCVPTNGEGKSNGEDAVSLG